MAKRKTRTTKRPSRVKPGRSTRIVIPQPKDRPLSLNQRDLVRLDRLTEQPNQFVKHRRGPQREQVGTDPREDRAVPKFRVKGTLPERIVYKALTDDFHLVSGVDFSFQSSQDGGRLELGGIVADFLFPIMRIVLAVQGPTHHTWIRKKKDEEQVDALAEMGYTVYALEEDKIYDAAWLDRRLRAIILGTSDSGGAGVNDTFSASDIELLGLAVDELEDTIGMF